ncbi:hypothetical protein BDZ91DRAFT_562247 [Kalaharituber pfeilii]|nr:hypothetical protein BDZ91DRAFT_562247 [Kalaharituber pfeilii]
MAESGVTKPFDSAHGGVLGAGFSLGLQQTKSITSCYEACFQGFRRLISVLGGGAAANVLSQSTEELQQRLETVHEQLGRFKMWAGNAGAHRSGKMSLDYRLREALHVHRQVVRLLEDLEHALEEAIRIITNPTPASEQNVETSPTVCSSDSSSDDAATECDPTDALSDDEGLSSVTDLEYAILDIAHVLKCLYRFSVVLHQPIPAERIQKCASIDVKHYEVWDIAHAVDKFRNAPEFLQQRLGRANTKRRQLFIYHEKHHQKITQFIDATPGPPVPEQPLATAPVGVTQMVMQPLKSTPGPGTAILSETTATAFHAMNNIVLKALPDDHESDTGQSQTSYASSYAGHSGLTSYRLSVPAPPLPRKMDSMTSLSNAHIVMTWFPSKIQKRGSAMYFQI